MSAPSGKFPPPSDPWSSRPDDSTTVGLTPPNPPAPLVPVNPHPPAAPASPPPAGPPPAGPPPAGGGAQLPPATAVVARIGELSVTSTTVHTPAGDIALRGSGWHVSDHWLTEQKTPAWAIVLAVFGFCLLTVFSLLFLLVKETVYRGTVQVTVTNGQRQYVARIPVTTQAEVQQVYQQVNYVRSLAAL